MEIDRYFDALAVASPQSEAAQAIRDRLLRYRKKLFTFVDYDNVPGITTMRKTRSNSLHTTGRGGQALCGSRDSEIT
jgi:hypothetical protein